MNVSLVLLSGQTVSFILHTQHTTNTSVWMFLVQRRSILVFLFFPLAAISVQNVNMSTTNTYKQADYNFPHKMYETAKDLIVITFIELIRAPQRMNLFTFCDTMNCCI